MGRERRNKLQQALPLPRQPLFQFPAHGRGRKEHARLRCDQELETAVDTHQGLKGQPQHQLLGACELCFGKLRAFKLGKYVQSAFLHAKHPSQFREFQPHVSEHRPYDFGFGQLDAEHEGLEHCRDAARPQHFALQVLSLQTQTPVGQGAVVRKNFNVVHRTDV